MFGKEQLKVLRLRKEMLVLKSGMDRVRLASDLHRVRSPEFWLVEAGNMARRHPVLTAALGGGAGLIAMRTLRRPVATSGWLERLGALGSTALSLWKLIADRKRE